MKLSLKELRNAHRALTKIDFPVSPDLMLYLSSQISEIEKRNRQRRIERMSDEELIALDEKRHTHLRVHLGDGSFIHMKSNKQTFEQAIRLIDFDAVPHHKVTVEGKRLFYIDASKKRRIVKKYLYIKPGLFVLTDRAANGMKRILETLDELLELGWDIELL